MFAVGRGAMNASYDDFLEWKRQRRGQGIDAIERGFTGNDGRRVEQETMMALPPVSSSRSLLDGVEITHSEPHSDSKFGPVIKPIVYGGLDGIVSVFVGILIAVVTLQPLQTVLALTLGKLFAGALSMGAGGFMSTKAEVDYARGERKREEWECENFKEGEIEEMVELYVAKGYKRETAERIVEILSRDNKVFVDTMLVEELEIPLEQAEQSPLKNLLVNFVSFMIFGTVPILPFIVYIIGRAVSCSGAGCAGSPWNNTFIPLYISIALTVLGVALLATIKARVTGIKMWISLGQSFVGALLSVAFGAGLAYAIYFAVGAAV